MTKCVCVLLATALAGCAFQDDLETEEGAVAGVDGGWTLAVDLLPCWPTPAPVRVELAIDGDEIVAGIAGVETSAPKLVVEGDTARVELLAFPVAGRRDAWRIDLSDDGEVAEAIVAWSDGACTVDGVPADVIRTR